MGSAQGRHRRLRRLIAARHLAARMGLAVFEKRASDLLSIWVGESEKGIARAFEEVPDLGAMLVIDEYADELRR